MQWSTKYLLVLCLCSGEIPFSVRGILPIVQLRGQEERETKEAPSSAHT